ncbi:pyrroline-5-carboxylate reductase [Bacteroides gallinaceum]|uniref:Pyrroline-5-carboxylate reductase n=2 Tax=Bacteroidales TaxID=171549 RepID=A0ABR8Y9F4_9BACT|nr:pyrroline-5-carboxylate reductase [Phocaeicola intestinalis]MBM6719775.1 pyrroline-5-carboxylate reductase [Bacteroides gallinaceum]OUN81407.1 pyrroline-5-carboxylate reductase [Bacteroides sp. An51A]OUO57170.1 pyrroline-5-carboxylate reductase [Bacteroides sp. An279]OUP29345.1 pyrroline-5-carboxylate reductase [Bacteroides sp. An19]CCZ71297.1 pyrroline-5-carboxylate reductase [Bacteroides sp. CAG:702]
MKVAIIGAGNMGGAIARGLAQGHYVRVQDITVTNPSMPKLEKLKVEFPAIQVSTDNHEAADADVVIVAVKPWKVEEVLKPLRLRQPQVLVSVAAGMTFEDLAHFVDPEMPMFRIIPNTAISLRASMTLIACRNASEQQTLTMLDLFNEMGLAMLIEEKQLAAATSLTSCGIAYVLKYVQAAMQAGVEAGIRPKDAMKMVAQTVEGAARLLLENEDTHPALEIEKVTTPGGITIKGVNSLEHDGFTSAVIKAIKASI